ncbi:MAG TPA: 4-alpha-glucanotransferase [Burkholderiaceae bacterium]|nr:4-alpha-glucanotransferase [Burkholderiaceae bacterium]
MTAAAPGHPLLSRRTSGVLLHLTSLPGRHGSGDMGIAALHFLDWLALAGQSLWQILPLTPPGAGHSPYQSPSAFAGSPWLVDLDDLVACGWLAPLPDAGFDTRHCDFARVIPYRLRALRAAWQGFSEHAGEPEKAALADFTHHHAEWLDDYALFMVLQARHGPDWTEWPQAMARRDPGALLSVQDEAAVELGFWHFVQWRFHVQWQRLREEAHGRGIHIVGDVPIFVAHQSADVWAHADQFLLDAQGLPDVVAGVPPDYFSATGQRWGNPLYRWDRMALDGYRWWKLRMAHLLTLVDVARLDHFRGFEANWEIPANEPTAQGGHWCPGPGRAFFQSIREELGTLPIIAEDLGIITDDVTRLRRACGFPGMRVMQFAFGDNARNPYLPHNFGRCTVAYTGTHDNNTTVGWWANASENERQAARQYLGPVTDSEIHWAMIQSLSQSVANTLVVPFQDVLGLDGQHRMNTPGQPEGCWSWRFAWADVGDEPARRLSSMVRAHGRA